MIVRIPTENLINCPRTVAWALTQVTLGTDIQHVDGSLTHTYYTKQQHMDLSDAKGLVRDGASIMNYPLLIEIDNINDYIPKGDLSWDEWATYGRRFLEHEGNLYVYTDAHTGSYLDVNLLTSSFYDLVDPKVLLGDFT